jgi:O-methyltransferase
VSYPVEISHDERRIIDYVEANGLTMTSRERMFATLLACRHAARNDVPGDFVECGVWRGGNSLVAAAVFRLYGVRKKVYLFDTFEGMTAPTVHDSEISSGKPASIEFDERRRSVNTSDWCFASDHDVRENFIRAGLFDDNLIIVKGDVLSTLDVDANLPKSICVLRLDTDWYESTRKELEVLYPRLVIGGSLLIDDYGHWSGSKSASDEFFQRLSAPPLMWCTDYTGRAGVKVA